ncbi:MAG: Glycoprotease family protein [uncultured bacterium]|uniref:Gcp-like domain-containing protein n=3 Tax=Candidatus Daviesiibacteriota TaxID=1752718 RepID=A0A0G0F826_9BACT|nr:MAG: Glycoprotease family protein [uncultured bacterium]KKQ09590.1 MAG: hypothetical protein US19_C0012G0024 [Candidatus Daviesbacteria bacterium GW2011_GWB1_36_5]KKQ16434.1 MAG: hypothetical protein US28_C0001G0024 [Candidatus Daviesbacteria bacterium GW2011_GWA1_36_8]OGE17767.1 MAG: tRNA (adenosine(37)-N6)-threonylcarbamoyltransferase complex dimerization subunit type 1 TsaB [Candidatus Daviesbacteria bacterium RIFCSPHIGHO2_01_FULL_36_37]
MILKIDTKDQKLVKISLKENSEDLDELVEENEFGSQVLLPLIEKILKKNGLEFKDLKGIEVEIGPGSYTGLKVGVSVANALGYSLGIPVNGKEIETEVKYE